MVVAKLNPESAWACKWWKIQDSGKPVPENVVHTVPLVPILADTAVFWDPPQSQSQKQEPERRKAPRPDVDPQLLLWSQSSFGNRQQAAALEAAEPELEEVVDDEAHIDIPEAPDEDALPDYLLDELDTLEVFGEELATQQPDMSGAAASSGVAEQVAFSSGSRG